MLEALVVEHHYLLLLVLVEHYLLVVVEAYQNLQVVVDGHPYDPYDIYDNPNNQLRQQLLNIQENLDHFYYMVLHKMHSAHN
jgi:hypothetical protein